MIWDLVALGLLCGLGNLQVCSAIGLLPIKRRSIHLLAIVFSLSEIGAALIGLLMGHILLSMFDHITAYIVPMAILACGALLWISTLRRQNLEKLLNSHRMLVELPLALSLNNLAAGAGVSLSSHSWLICVLTIGGIGACMSCIGLYSGVWIRRFVPGRIDGWIRGYLCFMALRMVWMDTI